MPYRDALLNEFQGESALTKKMLERVPFDHPEWKPHEKSMTVQRLASHLTDIPLWMSRIIDRESFEITTLFTARFFAKDQAELMKHFEATTAEAMASLQQASDETLEGNWSMLRESKTIYTRQKLGLLRGFIFSHTAHHRGQLSVYLRLLNVPVPGMYGPSADEQ